MSKYAHVKNNLLANVLVVLNPLMDDPILQIMVVLLSS